jgi:hypothetical protein
MKIEVTQQDIDNGRRCDPDCCPIGRALSRAGVSHYGVVGAAVMIEDAAHTARPLPLPSEVRNWIVEFDGSRPVEPITFNLPLPGEKKVKNGHTNSRTRQQAMLA